MQAPPSNLEQGSDIFSVLTEEEIEVLLHEYVLDATEALAAYLGGPAPGQKELGARRLIGIQQECPPLFYPALRFALHRHALSLGQLLDRLRRDTNTTNGPAAEPAGSIRQLANALAWAAEGGGRLRGAAAAAATPGRVRGSFSPGNTPASHGHAGPLA